MYLVDMHCDTLLACYQKNCDLRKNSLQVDLESMISSEGLAQFFAIFLPSGADALAEGIELEPWELFRAIYNNYIRELHKNNDILKPVLSYGDIMKNNEASCISGILTIEDGQLIGGDITKLQAVYNDGVRLMTLLWNKENCMGFPQSRDPEKHKLGLKPFGIEAVRRMNSLGMIVDVSHMSEGGFYDVAKYSSKPFVASHSCARALCDHPRNLTDDQLKVLADAGGVVGINFNSEFLRKDSRYTTVADIMAHIDYIVSLIGSDHVALGSDFDGIQCRLEMPDYGSYGMLVTELQKKYSEDVVEKICYKNVLHILQECI